MQQSAKLVALTLLTFLTFLAFGGHGSAAAGDKEDPLFGMTKVHAFRLEFAPAEWKKMQPAAKGFPGFPMKKAAGGEPADVHPSAGAFGTEFPWAKADLDAPGRTIQGIGVRYKGNFTYVASAQMLRRSLKIDLDHFDDAPRLFGQRKLNLSSGVTDPARTREALAFALYRAAGVPASRTAYVELTLSVPGKHEKELVGLYTLIEQIDKTFLKTHFKNSKGLLLKPENLRGGLEYLGEDWKAYESKYRPKYEGTPEHQKRLIAFTRLIHQADDETFAREVGAYLDVDAFVRFVAVDALMANLDSYLGFGHNFYLYLRPDTNRFVFMPWDVDLSMGMWPVGGPPERQIDLSLEHPHIGQNRLIDRLFRMKEAKEKYVSVLKELSQTCFSKEKLLKDVEALEAATKEPLERERKATAARKETGKGPFSGVVAAGPGLRVFVEKRTESVLAQLAGERKGYVPAGMGMAMGPPGGFKGPPGGFVPGGFGPGGFGPGNFVAKPLVEAINAGKNGKVTKEEVAAGAKAFFQHADKEKTGKLDETQIAAAINAIVPRPKGFPAPKAGAFGMGSLMAGTIMQRVGPEKDGKVTLETFVAAAEAWFAEADKQKKGHLAENEVAAALNQLVAPPPGFGPRPKD